MTSRQKQIWELLTENPCLSAAQIGRLLHVSDRTVRNDIKDINREMGREAIESVKGKGYQIGQQEERMPVSVCQKHEDEEDLEWELVRRVLFEEETDYLVMADELYISDTLLSKMIDRLNRTMYSRYDRGVIQKKDGQLKLKLTETEKRDYYQIYVTGRNRAHYFDITGYQKYFYCVNLEEIRDRMLVYEKLVNGQCYDITLVRLIISTAVLIERTACGFQIEASASALEAGEQERNLLRTLGGGISFSEEEYRYFARLLQNDFYEILEQDEEQIDTILRKILIEVSVEYGYDFSDNLEFLNEMKAQINGTTLRAENEQYSVNPVLFQIKSKYPLEYDMAIFFTDRLYQLTGIRAGEDEIGQFAVHFIWAMESSFGRTRQKVALINPFGKQFQDLIEKRINKMWDCHLTIAYEYSVFEYPTVMPPDVEVVLTTVPLPEPVTDTPVVLCRNFLDYHEIERILTVIRENQVTTVKQYFKALFKPALFFPDKEFTSKEQVIQFMCARLQKEGYVDEGFFESVMQREDVAPTAFEQGFAFAHAMKNDARRTAVCICILKNRIPWGGFKIKIIFLFALASSWNHTMIPVYNVMIDHLFEMNTVHRLSKENDFEAFLELLI